MRNVLRILGEALHPHLRRKRGFDLAVNVAFFDDSALINSRAATTKTKLKLKLVMATIYL